MAAAGYYYRNSFSVSEFYQKETRRKKDTLPLPKEPVTHTRDRIMNPQPLKQKK